jgi:hypothetical protein
VDEIRESASVDNLTAFNIGERGDIADSESKITIGHRCAEQQLVETGAPRMGDERVGDSGAFVIGGTKTPADMRCSCPRPDAGQSLVGEPESVPDRLTRREGNNFGGPKPSAQHRKQCTERVEKRIVGPQGAIGDTDRKCRNTMARIAGEGRLHQWSKAGDIRGQHCDVARMKTERAVIVRLVEEPDQCIAQHFDLTGRSVRAVPTQARIRRRIDRRSLIGLFRGGRTGRRCVSPKIVLKAIEER